jgi:leader peptidase (prepilin peptidase)/N-methyltransferase
VLLTLLGLAAGSFVNCAALRAVKGEPVSRGRSHCPACGHVLSAFDLFPLFSWLFLRGRCRYCQSKISIRYPLTELIAAVIYVSAYLRWGVSLKTLEMLFLGTVLLWIALVDMDSYIIPDGLILTGVVGRIIFIFLSGSFAQSALNALIGAASIALPLLIVVLVFEKVMKKEGMGGGDIKLLAMTGMFFDWKINLLALFLACLAGIAFALATRRRGDKAFPFGPAIACGTWLAMLFGDGILAAYMGLFGL